MAACINSIVRHNSNTSLKFHVFAMELPDSDIDRIRTYAHDRSIDLTIHPLGAEVVSRFPPPEPPFSFAIYVRLLMCERLAGIADRLLYLDADIICQGGLAGLVAMPMDGKVAAVVADAAGADKTEIALQPGQRYFNSGVMLIDVGRWNRERITERTIAELTRRGAGFAYPDQDALNIALRDEAAFVDGRWNLLMNQHRPDRDTVLLHYAGDKPWDAWSKTYGHEAFVSNLAETPWAGWERATPLTRKQRSQHARRLLATGHPLAALYWRATMLAMPKRRRA
jgi:lipopolysaccharide biosynthesis glycosyltransferase